MIRVKLDADARINAVRINGDFFLHPEDALPELEKGLTGLPSDASAPEVAQKIHQALAIQKAAFLGVTPEHVAETVIEALQNGAPE